MMTTKPKDKDMKKVKQKQIGTYIRLCKVGEGTYGTVFKGLNGVGGTVALKRVKLEGGVGNEEGVPSTTIREIGLLKKLQHPHIVCLKDVEVCPRRIYLVFEFLSQDLKKYMDAVPDTEYIKPATVKRLLHEITDGVAYCHQKRIIHRDLKPQNILLDERATVKLADFGLARTFEMPSRMYTIEVVTLWYRAPEVMLGSNRYTTAVDVWSIGCIFAEMAEAAPLFRGDSEIDELFKIFKVLGTPNEKNWEGVEGLPEFKSVFPKWPSKPLSSIVLHLNDSAIHLLQQMLEYNPNQRITAKQILRHPFFEENDSQPSSDSDSDSSPVIVM